ncbi:MAG TPA: hypothetical protein DCQ98_19850 [Planctomycetaceae bacterium]|nr:hypothetical protein [Planctomycetaceae bacterium]
MNPHIEILIDPAGGVRIAPHGYGGRRCERVTYELERELGVVSDRVATAERYALLAEDRLRNEQRLRNSEE